MNLKTRLIVLTLFILTSQKIAYGQESDTICLPISDVKILAASHEKLIFADSLIKLNDEEIQLLYKILDEKQDQIQIGESFIHGYRNEVNRLKRQRTFLSVGLGGALVGLVVFLVK